MIRSIILTAAALITLASISTPAQAGFDLDDLGRLLRSRGHDAQFHRDGYYVIHHGGHNVRIFPSNDGSHLIFRTHLVTLEQRHFDHPQFRQVLRLHQTFGFEGQFNHQGNQLYFQYRIDRNDFRPHQLDDHLRHISRTIDRHSEQWNPKHWSNR
jgi:hypothetical protein